MNIIMSCVTNRLTIGHIQLIRDVLCKESLYANLKKCTFCIEKIVLLGYVIISAQVLR